MEPILATLPPGVEYVEWTDDLKGDVVAFCDWTVWDRLGNITGTLIHIDAVRVPDEILSLPFRHIAAEAPVPGMEWLWLPSPDVGAIEKDIDVLVAGNRKQHGDRGEAVEVFKYRIPGFVYLGDLGFFPWPEYMRYICRARIVVNFGYNKHNTFVRDDVRMSPDGRAYQLKSRFYEAGQAGCCVLETPNALTRERFTPGVEYVEWDSPEDAVEKIKRLLDGGWKQFGERLEKRMANEYNSRLFWQNVL